MTKAVRRAKIVALQPTTKPNVLNANRESKENAVRKMIATKTRKMCHLALTRALRKRPPRAVAKRQKTSLLSIRLAKKRTLTTSRLIQKIQRTPKGLQNRIRRPRKHRKRIPTLRPVNQRRLVQNPKTSPANNRAPAIPPKIRNKESLKKKRAINRLMQTLQISR